MISYELISKAINYYNSLGYQYVETPWRVTEEIINITKPIDSKSFKIDDKCLVASGEQSFLYQFSKGFLPQGIYQTVTPCFRSDVHDTLHQKQFIKLELINTINPTKDELMKTISDVQKFYNQFLKTDIIEMEDSFDINYEDIELGSYGIRTYKNLKWIYATGIAEPRFSNTLKEIQNGIS